MRLLITLSVLSLAVTVGAAATPLVPPFDPEILIDSDCCSIPLSTNLTTVQPKPDTDPAIYDFFNDTQNIVTSFRFQTTINAHLSQEAIASFTCAIPGGYFLNCGTSYFPDSTSMFPAGTLIYTFSGVNPSDNDENTDPEILEQEGIPPGGHFKITLMGWTPNAMAATGETLYSGLPSLDNTFTQSPEPAVALTLGTGLLVLAAMLRRRQRNR